MIHYGMLTEAALKVVYSEGQDFAPTVGKLNSFRAGYAIQSLNSFEIMIFVKTYKNNCTIRRYFPSMVQNKASELPAHLSMDGN